MTPAVHSLDPDEPLHAPMITEGQRREELVRASRDWPSWTVTARQLGDLELILNGGYAPLDRFMTRDEAERCAREMALADGSPFPEPILLDIADECGARAEAAGRLVLRDPEGVALAVLEVRDSWRHGRHFVGGPILGLQLPNHHDAPRVRWTPASVAEERARREWRTAIAYPTRGVIDRPQYAATQAALEQSNDGLVVMALADPAEDDSRRFARIRALEAVMPRYAPRRPIVWLVPLARRPRPVIDALVAALVARNAGCTSVVLTEQFGAADTTMLTEFAERLQIPITYSPVKADVERSTFPEVAEELAILHPPPHRRGFTVFFTGLSGSGKSTIANLVRLKLLERAGRAVTLLDGDLVRQHLSSELGFSRTHRDLNIRRIAFVAAEVTKHGGIAICAPIAPYENVRRDARRAIEAVGDFMLVFVDTPLEVCEARDRKGLYAKARAGLIEEFTGVSDPYERPTDADLVVDTTRESADAAADRIVAVLEQRGYLRAGGGR